MFRNVFYLHFLGFFQIYRDTDIQQSYKQDKEKVRWGKVCLLHFKNTIRVQEY